MTAKSDRLRAHITKLITKEGYARRQAIAIAYDLESKGCLTKDGKVKERCKSKRSRKRCKRGIKKGSRSCKRKPGPKRSKRSKRSKRRCKRGMKKRSRSCKRKPGPKK